MPACPPARRSSCSAASTPPRKGRLGLRAPEDLAVIGFDDTAHGALFSPALTTVHVEAESIGRSAARAALGLPTTGTASEPARVLVRESAWTSWSRCRRRLWEIVLSA